jgi:hypothetical protein
VTSRPRSAIAIVVALALVAAACQSSPSSQPGPSAVGTATTPPASVAGPSPAASVDRVTGWRSDLGLLVPGMDRLHPDLTHGSTLEALNAAVDELAADVPNASDDELMVGVARIVALVSAEGCDAHTGAFVWGTGTYPVDSLPFRLWLFEDEVVIVDALPPFEDLIDSRIDTVEGRPIREVIAALDPLIPRDNAQTVRLLTPRFLLIPQVLRGLGIAGDGPIALGLTLPSGVADVRLVEPVPMAEYNAWAGPYGLHLPEDPDVLYLSDIADDLWWQVLPDTRTLYIQYNRVEPQTTGLLDELGAALGDPAIERVVLDIRHNYGGELSALDAIEGLFEEVAGDIPGQLFVITGRNTFSAGSLLVARLDANTDATFVGEPMSGCPTTWGDSMDLDLPFSGIDVSVATELSVGVNPDDPRDTIEPDQPVPLTREDWRDGIDPMLEHIVVFVP